MSERETLEYQSHELVEGIVKDWVKLPTLPGKAPGIVAVRQGPRGNIYTLQCQRCYITEEPANLLSMTIAFHARSRDGENPRLCRDCRLTAYPDCICDYCDEDRSYSKESK